METFPDSGVAGWYWEGGKLYLQATSSGENNGQFQEVFDLITYSLRVKDVPYEWEIVIVKYDYGQLWRWAETLNRLRESAGNTLGITGAQVSKNVGGEETVWPSDTLSRAPGTEESKFRETVRLYAYDPQRVAKALPTLLAQLGIPQDAVGMIVRDPSVDLLAPSMIIAEPGRAVDSDANDPDATTGTDQDVQINPLTASTDAPLRKEPNT